MEQQIMIISAIVLGLTSAVNQTGYLNSKFKPLLAITFGLIIALGAYGISPDSFITGLLASLSAMGLYSGTKNTLK